MIIVHAWWCSGLVYKVDTSSIFEFRNDNLHFLCLNILSGKALLCIGPFFVYDNILSQYLTKKQNKKEVFEIENLLIHLWMIQNVLC